MKQKQIKRGSLSQTTNMAKVNQELPNGSVTDETGNRSIGTCVFTFKLDLHT